MRTTTLLALLMVAALSACGGASAGETATPAASPGSSPTLRELTGPQIAAEMGTGWNLGNSLEAIPGETAWVNPAVNQALLDAVRAAGFSTVRIPVAWKQHADAQDQISSAWMDRVAEVVGYARKAGLYVIVNTHWDGGWAQPTYAAQAVANARLKSFWTQIATRFRDADEHLLFAGTNEVMVEGDYGTPKPEYVAVQNGFNQVFVDAVRATGGNNARRHLIVQGFNTNVDHTLAFFTLPRDSVTGRLLVEVHYYDPYPFTLDDKSSIWQWGAGATDKAATAGWGDEAHADAQFRKMQTAFVDRGIAVILGEFGAIRRSEQPGAEAYRLAWDRYIAASARGHGLVPVYWDAGAATSNHSMGLFDRQTGAQVYPALVKALMP